MDESESKAKRRVFLPEADYCFSASAGSGESNNNILLILLILSEQILFL